MKFFLTFNVMGLYIAMFTSYLFKTPYIILYIVEIHTVCFNVIKIHQPIILKCCYSDVTSLL